MCGCEKITRTGAEGVSPREVWWDEVRPSVRFRPGPHCSAHDGFRETHGGLVIQDKDSRVMKDSVDTDKAS